MSRGTIKDLFIFRNGQYYFESRERPRVQHGMDPVTPSPPRVNRGNHFNGNYGKIKGNNGAKFKEYNDKVKLIAIQKKVPLDVAQKYISEFDSWTKHKKQQRQKEVRKSLATPKNYGGLIRNPGYVSWTTEWKTLEEKPKDEYDRYEEENFADTPPPNKYYW